MYDIVIITAGVIAIAALVIAMLIMFRKKEERKKVWIATWIINAAMFSIMSVDYFIQGNIGNGILMLFIIAFSIFNIVYTIIEKEDK